MIWSFLEYISALWQHWLWIMTGGPFALEKIAKAVWPDRYEAWVSRFALPVTRARITGLVAIIGIFVASFLAFNDERNAFLKANEELEAARGYPSHPYEPLTSSQTQKLTQVFQKLPHPKAFIAVVSTDRSAADLAEQIRKALKPALGSISVQSGWLSGEDSGCGICFEVVDVQTISPQQNAYLKAFSDGGVDAKVTSSFDVDQLNGYDFVLFIGPKRH